MTVRNLRYKPISALDTSMRLGAAAVAACFLALPALGNPTNGTVVNGSATFQQVGNVLTVTNSNGAIIALSSTHQAARASSAHSVARTIRTTQ